MLWETNTLMAASLLTNVAALVYIFIANYLAEEEKKESTTSVIMFPDGGYQCIHWTDGSEYFEIFLYDFIENLLGKLKTSL